MTDTPAKDFLEPFQISKEWFAVQQTFLPQSAAYAQVAETMRSIAQANTTYVQEVMRANAALLAAFMPRPPADIEERPSEVAHRRETATS